MFDKTEAKQTNYSLDLYQKKDYKKAEKICRKILKKNSNNATVLINLGNILFIKKEYDEARFCYQKAEQVEPDSFIAKVNISNLYLEKGDYPRAEEYARKALQINPNNYMGLNVLGTALLEQEKYDEAITILKEALVFNNQDSWLYNYLSRCYQEKGLIEAAIQSGWQAIQISPQEESHHINFGYMLYEMSLDSNDKMIKEYALKWLQNFPQNKMAEHMGKAILNEAIPEFANVEYVQKIFDVFAPDFEKVLEDLEYQTPQIMGKFLTEIYGTDSHPKLSILDAGCGTGLCGKFLKPYARFLSLEGVDISSKMLEKAREKKLYNKLFCQDIIEFLSGKKQSYDLIVSADVLTYMGKLDSFFSSAAKALKQQGRILFSITANSLNDSDYILHQSGRYHHHRKYVEKQIKKYGFFIEKEEYKTIRKEASEDVKGYIFCIKKTLV